MKLSKKVLSIFLCLSLTLSLTFCDKIDNNNTSYNSTTISNADTEKFQTEFSEFTLDLFKNEVSENTLTLNYKLKDPSKYGIETSEITFGDLNYHTSQEDLDKFYNAYEKLQTFDYNSLTKEQQITYDVLYEAMKIQADYGDNNKFADIIGLTYGVPYSLISVLSDYSFHTETDIPIYLTLLETIEDYFTQIIDFYKQQINDGYSLPDECLDIIIKQCQKFIDVDITENTLITSFNKRIKKFDISEKKQKNYINQNLKIIKNKVIPTYKNFIDVLESLKGTSTIDGGLSNYEGGKEYYEYLVKSITCTQKSIKELKKEINERIDECIEEIQNILILNYSLIDEVDNVDFKLTDPYEILDNLKEKIKTDFPEIENVTYSVSDMPKSVEDNQTLAYYTIAPIDENTENIICVNNSLLSSVSTSLFTTLAHEGYPGHLYQYNYSKNNDVEPIRLLTSLLGFAEGWASYVEIYSYELADIENPLLVKLLQENSILNLMISALIDIGINYESWTLNDLTEFLADYGIENKTVIKDTYYSTILDPGTMLPYSIGYLEMENLKNYAENKLKDKFNLKEFNTVILDTAPAQFSVLQKAIDDYIQTVK